MSTAEQRHERGECWPQACKYCWWEDDVPEDQGERNEDVLEQEDFGCWQEGRG